MNFLLLPIFLFFQEPVVQVVPHGQHDLTLKEVIETLAEFDVKHVEQQPFFRPAFGVTDFSANPPSIWIFNTSDTTSKRGTVIHELLHVYYRAKHMDPPEEFIDAEENRIYEQLFAGDEK